MKEIKKETTECLEYSKCCECECSYYKSDISYYGSLVISYIILAILVVELIRRIVEKD